MQKSPDLPTPLALAALIFATPALSGTPALAGSDTTDAGIAGIWCSTDGSERLNIGENSIAFNEHTICNLKEPLPLTALVKSELGCANVYIDGDEVYRVFEKTLAFRAELTANNQLEVTLRDEGAPPKSLRYQRCDN